MDLESCYNRQLVNLISIVLESISIDRKAIKLTIKVISSITHYICTEYGISTLTYGSESKRTTRTE